MKKGNFLVYVGVFALAALALLVFVYFSNSIFDSLKKTDYKDNLVELKEQVTSQDIKIYWIGDCPSRLNDVNPVMVSSVVEENLPLEYRYVETVKVEDGKKIYESVCIEQDCPTYAVIVITRTGLTDEQRGFISRSLRERGTRLILLGKDVVDEYREFLFMPTGKTINYTSMLVIDGSYHDNIFSDETIKDIDSPEFAQEFLEYIISEFGFDSMPAETDENAH